MDLLQGFIGKMQLTQASFRSWGVNSVGCCLFLCSLWKRELKSQLPPVSPPETELSETTSLAPDHFRLSSKFLTASTSLCMLLTQNGNLLHINKCSSYTPTYMHVIYVCTYAYSVKYSSSVCNQTPAWVQISQPDLYRTLTVFWYLPYNVCNFKMYFYHLLCRYLNEMVLFNTWLLLITSTSSSTVLFI